MSVIMVPLSFTRKAISVTDSTEKVKIVSSTPLPSLCCTTQNAKQRKILTNLHCLVLPSPLDSLIMRNGDHYRKNAFLTCTKAWTASICPVIFRLSSPSPVQNESKEQDVSILTRQCLFRALYSTRLINRPNPCKNWRVREDYTHEKKGNLAKNII